MANVRLLYGEEGFLIKDEVERAIAKIPVAVRVFNLSQFYAEESEPTAVLEALFTSAFGGDSRLVILYGVDKWSAAKLEVLGKNLRQGLPANLSFILTATKIDKRLGFYKTLSKLGELQEFKPLKEAAVLLWLKNRARQLYQRSLADEAALLLVEFNGTDLAALAQELAKLDQYVNKAQTITHADVLAVGSNAAAANIFAYVDALGQKNTKQALLLLRQLISDRVPLLQIIGMITRHLIILGQLRVQAQGMGLQLHTRVLPRDKQAPLAQAVGVHPYFLNRYWEQTQNFSTPALTYALNRTARADLRLKLGWGEEELVLLTMAICNNEGIAN